MFVFVCFCTLLNSTLIKINQDGTGDYTTIQDGINEAVNGDTVLVHPGTYFENIDYVEKSITVGSLNLTTNDTIYITNTIIDGNQNGSCAVIENVEEGVLQGFTFQNGSGRLGFNTLRAGGGIYIINSNFSIINSNIKNNSSDGAGGIYIKETILMLSNVDVFNNQAYQIAGGIFINSESSVLFDPENLCSVFLNTASRNNDITLRAENQNIELDKFTVMEPDVHYIGARGPAPYTPYIDYEFSCQQAAIIPTEADLYVSTTGDDDNSGLTPDDALQTMAFALIKIKSDSLNPHTIHIADGVYSASVTNEKFPLNLKSYVGLMGESEENTILDGENGKVSFMVGYDGESEMKIKNFTMKDLSIGWGYRGAVLCHFTMFEDDIFGFTLDMENITIQNINPLAGDDSNRVIEIYYSDETNMKNITLKNNLSDPPLSISGYNMSANNIRITDNFANYENCNGGGVSISNFLTTMEGDTNTIANLEITNNIDTEFEWNMSSVLYVGVNNSVIISNATISDNACHSGYGGAISLTAGNLTLINSIVHGNYPYPAYIREDASFGPSEFIVQNCLFTNGQNDIQFTGMNNFEWLTGNISGNPEFQGDNSDYPYNFLSTSPCIDAGTLVLPEEIELPEYDLAGNPRIYGDNVDMGGYEWQGVNADEFETEIMNINLINYPNPFSQITNVSFSISNGSNVELSIYNIKGQKVKTLINGRMQKGKHSIIWSGLDGQNQPVSSGLYFYKLKKGNQETVKRMIMLK